MSKKVKFEDAMQELETLVSTLERGDMPLEDALKGFEKGVGLARDCQKQLQDAELKIEKIMSTNEDGSVNTEPFEAQ